MRCGSRRSRRATAAITTLLVVVIVAPKVVDAVSPPLPKTPPNWDFTWPMDGDTGDSDYSTVGYDRGTHNHGGNDLGAPCDEEVYAARGGTVTTGWDAAAGNYINIAHNDDFETRYLHLERFASGISTGVKVDAFEYIGDNGDTGNAQGCHLHFEVNHGTGTDNWAEIDNDYWDVPFDYDTDIEHHEPMADSGDSLDFDDSHDIEFPQIEHYLRNSHSTGTADDNFNFGRQGDHPIYCDWDGADNPDGETLAVLRGNVWFILDEENKSQVADLTFSFGPAVHGGSLIPICGDWDGDGDETIGVYDAIDREYFLRNTNSGGTADVSKSFGNGTTNYYAVSGDFDGDGDDTVALRLQYGTIWYINNNLDGDTSDAGDTSFSGFGWATDYALIGDWDGDGDDTIGVYRPGTSHFYLRNTSSNGSADESYNYGRYGDWPAVGDFDGDDETTATLTRPTDQES